MKIVECTYCENEIEQGKGFGVKVAGFEGLMLCCEDCYSKSTTFCRRTEKDNWAKKKED